MDIVIIEMLIDIAIEIKTSSDGWKENLKNVKNYFNDDIFFLSSNQKGLAYTKNEAPPKINVQYPWNLIINR